MALRNIYRQYARRGAVEEEPMITAGRILEAAQIVTRDIESKLASMPDDGEPLFVVLGEHHDLATHKLAEMRIVHDLQRKGYKVAVGLENSYNLAQTSLEKEQQQNPSAFTDIMAEQLQTTPHGDSMHVWIAEAALMTEETYLTNKARLKSFTQSGVSVGLNDAARSDANTGRYLDHEDSYLQGVIHGNEIDTGDKAVDAFSALGISLRNQVMMTMATGHAAGQKPDIYIQICGALHMAGHENPGPALGALPYSQSLTALYEAKGRYVLGVPLFNDDFTEASLPADRSGAVVKGPTLNGPAFKGVDNPRERAWLAEVMSYVMPHRGPDQAASRPVTGAAPRDGYTCRQN